MLKLIHIFKLMLLLHYFEMIARDPTFLNILIILSRMLEGNIFFEENRGITLKKKKKKMSNQVCCWTSRCQIVITVSTKIFLWHIEPNPQLKYQSPISKMVVEELTLSNNLMVLLINFERKKKLYAPEIGLEVPNQFFTFGLLFSLGMALLLVKGFLFDFILFKRKYLLQQLWPPEKPSVPN